MRKLNRLIFKLSRFEYWPFSFLYIPAFLYYLLLVFRHRSFFFFTASNPTIDFGGMMGESKMGVYHLIPAGFIPKTFLFQIGTKPDEIISKIKTEGLEFPIILKPDVGERGWMVEKIKNIEDLTTYLINIKVPFLLQEWVEYPIELGIFYVRLPNELSGKVTSLTQKSFLSVTGDGKSTVKSLLESQKRAQLTFNFNAKYYQDLLYKIPKAEEKLIVESIGNHCRGTEFINLELEIDEPLRLSIDTIAKQIPEFYFGRFDLRCASLESLKKGEDFKIIELNGAGAEPGHIYGAGISVFKAWRSILFHLYLLSAVSLQNQKKGIKFMVFRDGWKKINEIRNYNKRK